MIMLHLRLRKPPLPLPIPPRIEENFTALLVSMDESRVVPAAEEEEAIRVARLVDAVEAVMGLLGGGVKAY
jgi:hypothetical protein